MLSLLSPRGHCTWFKVWLLLDTLASHPEFSHIVWIDADAVVVDHSLPIDSFIDQAGDRDLILAENMNLGFLINAGVLIVKNSVWSRGLWEEVWDSSKYFNTCFYEQSALLRALKARREGLLQISPFHSFEGGPSTKVFPHVYVCNHMELNTNKGWVFPKRSLRGSSEYSVHEGEEEETCARFIFHAAGMRNKMSAIRGMLRRFGIEVPVHVDNQANDFRLFRNSVGGRATVTWSSAP